MDNLSMKNMVVLKDLPSNIVDEAIVIFKQNINLEKYKKESQENSKNKTKTVAGNSEFAVKEAENVIANYISEIERPKKLEQINKNLQIKYNRIKTLSILLGVLAFLGVIVNLI